MKKEHIKIDLKELKPFEKNPKKHNDELIEKSIKELGFIDDIVIDESNKIMAGHGRLKALKKLGYREIDVIRITGWTEKQKDQYLLLSNKSVERGGWDLAKLAEFDEDMLLSAGFEEDDLGDIFGDDSNEVSPELEFAEELLLEHNYVVMYFDNAFDWEVAQEKFGLKKVKDFIPRKGQPSGIGRVIKGSEWLGRIK